MIVVRLSSQYSKRLNDALSLKKRNSPMKVSSALVLLGCSIEELKAYLESQFEDWMTF